MSQTADCATPVDSSTIGAEPNRSVGRYRWTMAALLFFATTINYIDRGVLSVLAPMLQSVVGWNEIQYSNIVSAFTLAYAIGLLAAGNFIDRVGTRAGYAIVITVWSLAAMGHAWVRSVFGFGVMRFLLGLGEAGSFPAAVKTVAEWFPKKERALATGIFNSGTNVGPTLAPIVVPWLALRFGWQWAFLLTGLAGFPWLIAWLILYRRPQSHPRVSAAELAHIDSDPPDSEVKLPWKQLLYYRQTWALVAAKVLADPIWWFLLFWLPPFLKKQYAVDVSHIGLPLFVIYNVAFLGSLTGGWLPARFLNRGWTLNRARKITMLLCALAVFPLMFATRVPNLWFTVALVSLAAAGHQGWSANVWTLSSDLFPRKAVASVAGIGGFASAMAAVLFQKVTGYILQFTGSYSIIFIIGGCAYLTAVLIVHLLAPRLTPARI